MLWISYGSDWFRYCSACRSYSFGSLRFLALGRRSFGRTWFVPLFWISIVWIAESYHSRWPGQGRGVLPFSLLSPISQSLSLLPVLCILLFLICLVISFPLASIQHYHPSTAHHTEISSFRYNKSNSSDIDSVRSAIAYLFGLNMLSTATECPHPLSILRVTLASCITDDTVIHKHKP